MTPAEFINYLLLKNLLIEHTPTVGQWKEIKEKLSEVKDAAPTYIPVPYPTPPANEPILPQPWVPHPYTPTWNPNEIICRADC